jgi:hypothetical protein
MMDSVGDVGQEDVPEADDARSFVSAAHARSIGSALHANTTVETVPASSGGELPMSPPRRIPGRQAGFSASRPAGAPGRSRRANDVIASKPAWVVRIRYSFEIPRQLQAAREAPL